VLIDTARTFHVDALRVILFVIFPAALPAIMAGLRVAIGLALVVTIVAEMTAGSSGFGYYIVQMQFAMRPQAMYAAIIILALTGYALNGISLRIERSVLHWKPS
jgi:ABC-type nitrate/sulfonate/bicarbonate transport system permease component